MPLGFVVAAKSWLPIVAEGLWLSNAGPGLWDQYGGSRRSFSVRFLCL